MHVVKRQRQQDTQRHWLRRAALWAAGLLLSGAGTAGAAQYLYDDLNRLTEVRYENGAIQTYTYDDTGNRLTAGVRFDTPPMAQDEPAHQDGATSLLPQFFVNKRGRGRGTIAAGEQVCGPDCDAMTCPYVAESSTTLQVQPESGSVFLGWQTADGRSIDHLFYAAPGETVFAVFDHLGN